MQSNFKTLKKPLASINWNKWLLAIVVIIMSFPLYRFIKGQIAKNQDQEAQLIKNENYVSNLNPITQQSRADKITTRKDIQADANAIAHHLGTKYSDKNSWTSLFDWQGWSENDAEAAKIIIRQRLNFKLVERLYYECYSNSRNLRNDCLKLIDQKELVKIQKYKIL